MSYHREHWKKWATVVGDYVPAVRTAVDVYDAGTQIARPSMAYQWRGHPLIGERPWRFPGPPADPWRTQDVLGRIGGLLNVPAAAPGASGRMDAAEQWLYSLPPAEVDAVVGGLGSGGIVALDALLSAAEQEYRSWGFYRVQDFLNFLLENTSPAVMGLVGAYMGCSQPPVHAYWEDGHDDGWIQPAGPFVVFDKRAYRTDDGSRVEASIAPMAWQDMLQGQVGDCWFLTSTQAVAKANPAFVPRHLWCNANGSVSAVFHDENDHTPHRITVAPDLPARDGYLFCASGHTDDPAYAELWPGYYEKAFAQLRGGYDRLEGGFGHQAFNVITGLPIEPLDPRSPYLAQELQQRFQHGCAAVVCSWGRSDADRLLDGRLVANHAYFVKDVDVASGGLCLGNPWGDIATRQVWECWLSRTEVAENLQEVSVVRP